MPKQIVNALEMNAFNLTTLNGYLGGLFFYYALMGAIAAGLWGSGVIAGEERNKTIEFALTLPVSRARFLTAKALAALTLSLAFVLVTWGATLLTIQPYDPDGDVYAYLARLMLAMAAIEVIFLTVGLLAACALKRPKRAGSVVIAVILTTFYLSMISGLDERVDFLKYLTPFKYFDAAALLHQGGVEGVYWALSAGVVGACLAGAFWAYNRRDVLI